MFLVGQIIDNEYRFICRDAEYTKDLREAIDYGTYDNAKRVASYDNMSVIKVHVTYSYKFEIIK